MYFLLAITLALISLLVFNTLASFLVTFLWQILARSAFGQTARQQSQRIFALRVFPFALAVVFITAFLLPAYFLFEPETPNEVISLKLEILALVSAAGIALASYRVCQTWLATRRLVKNWLREAEPIQIEGVFVPVYRIRHSFPVIAVIGAISPRMFIAEQIFDSLTKGEIKAALVHERGHLVSRDNLKRTLMRFCRDLLLIPHGRNLERAWANSAEAAADEYVARIGGKKMALELAAALIKIARIVPPGAHPAMPAGAFLVAEETHDVTKRVQSLVCLTEAGEFGGAPEQFGQSVKLWIYASFIFAAVIFLAAHRNLLFTIYEAMEVVIHALQ